MKTIILNLIILTSLFQLNAQEKKPVHNLVQLVVKVSNIENHSGTLYIALYSNENGFNNKKPIETRHMPVDKNNISLSFNQLPKGTYAILCFQDLNANKKMDFNNFMPDEPWGLSNNISRMGPPSWNDAKFILEGNHSISIELF